MTKENPDPLDRIEAVFQDAKKTLLEVLARNQMEMTAIYVSNQELAIAMSISLEMIATGKHERKIKISFSRGKVQDDERDVIDDKQLKLFE